MVIILLVLIGAVSDELTFAQAVWPLSCLRALFAIIVNRYVLRGREANRARVGLPGTPPMPTGGDPLFRASRRAKWSLKVSI